MENMKYLSLGSIALLNGGTKKVMVIARGLVVKGDNNQNYFFDYGGVRYPEGLTGNNIVYFNNDQVANVVFEGYHSEEDEPIMKNLYDYLEKNPDMPRYHLELDKIKQEQEEISGADREECL